MKRNLIFKKFHKPPFSKYGMLVQKEIDKNWEEAQEKYMIKANSGTDKARRFPAGTQQKVILARELGGDPEIVILNQPTRGLDIGAAEYVRQQILNARNRGAAGASCICRPGRNHSAFRSYCGNL